VGVVKIQTAIINITNLCPLNCIGCWVEKKNQVMSLEDLKKIINKLPKLDNITLSGGEPFTHKSILEICKYIYKKKKIKPQILTSGAVKVDLKKIKDYVSRIFVTIKYPNNWDNNWKRNDNAFSLAVDFLEQCKKNKISIAINNCIDKCNVNELGNVINFAEKYNAELHLLKFLPYQEETKKIYLKKNVWEEVCRKVSRIPNVKIDFPSPYSYELCVAGVNRMCIQTDGSVTSCLYDTFNIIGNILKESYPKIEEKLYNLRESFGNKKGCPIERALVPSMWDKFKENILLEP